MSVDPFHQNANVSDSFLISHVPSPQLSPFVLTNVFFKQLSIFRNKVAGIFTTTV